MLTVVGRARLLLTVVGRCQVFANCIREGPGAKTRKGQKLWQCLKGRGSGVGMSGWTGVRVDMFVTGLS